MRQQNIILLLHLKHTDWDLQAGHDAVKSNAISSCMYTKCFRMIQMQKSYRCKKEHGENNTRALQNSFHVK